MLNRRQVDVQFQNLATMCRMTVKSLIDYACVNSHVDEDCEEFVNFCAVFEQMVAHRIRPYQKKVWHRGQGLPRHFWEVMLDSHRQGPLFRSCIPNIEAIESIKSPRAKLRAFVRVALMEKRLSDYLQWLQNNRSLMEECYLDGALFTSEEGLELCGDIIGLSAIDFNFCLRGNENDLLGPLEINYVPFLNYTQSQASRLIDEEEMLQLSGKMRHDDTDLSQQYNDDKFKLQTLERDFRGVKEQKDYLEELVRLRERQTGEANLRVEAMRASALVREKEWEAERRMLDACVIELQDEISNLRNQTTLLKSQVSDLQQFKTRLEYRDVQMIDLAGLPVSSDTGAQDDNDDGENSQQADDRSETLPMMTVKNSSTSSSKHTSSDQKSILSGISDQIRLKEDTQSLVPLTGSLADVNIAMIRDNQQTSEEAHGGDWKRAETGSTASENRAKDKDGFVNVELTLFESGGHKNSTESSALTTTTDEPSQLPAPSSSSALEASRTATSPTNSNTSSPLAQAIDPADHNNSLAHCNVDESYVVTGTDSDGEKVEDIAESKICATLEVDGGETGVPTGEVIAKGDNELKEGKDSTARNELQQQSPPSSSDGKDDQNMCGSAISEALHDLEKAFDAEADDSRCDDKTSHSQLEDSCAHDSNESGREDINTSSTSDPEILDTANMSSEGSDATWELLSDPDESDK